MKAGFLDKLIERIDRVAPDEVQAHLLRLIEEKGLLEGVFQALQEGVLLTDPQGTITYVNSAACRFCSSDKLLKTSNFFCGSALTAPNAPAIYNPVQSRPGIPTFIPFFNIYSLT